MLKALLGWLFGRRPAPSVRAPAATPATRTQDDPGFRKLNRDAPLRAEQSAEQVSGEPATFLCREAVLGRNQRIAGYQFMLREGSHARIRHSTRRVHHLYAEVLVRSLASADIGELLGHRMAFIDVPDSFLTDPSLARLPARSVVLVPTLNADRGAPEPEALRHTVEGLRQRGFRLGLPDPTVVTEFAHLLPQADFIVVQAQGLDARRGLQLSNIVLEIAPNARLLIRGLPSIEEFRFCYKLGATFFQGPFVTSREDWRERELPPNTARIGTLIARLRADASTHELADLLKQDAALSLRLLRYINSAANMLPQPVSSIEHALTLLGRDKLHRWLILLVCSAGTQGERGSAALETALVRGRMMELLGVSQPPAEREALFLVGLLSLVDVILQVPMEKALAPLALSPDIDAALRAGGGPLQPLLDLAIACERSDSEHLREAAERCGISPEQASECHMQALSWAIEIQD
ncbi:MAG TPA: signal transduction protein [Thauera sp.]|nr:signal transduction protein [Thauera sp.]HHW63043.1 HDOD domain-containing protein [Rhodocyclaceae bacterium]